MKSRYYTKQLDLIHYRLLIAIRKQVRELIKLKRRSGPEFLKWEPEIISLLDPGLSEIKLEGISGKGEMLFFSDKDSMTPKQLQTRALVHILEVLEKLALNIEKVKELEMEHKSM